MKWLSFLACLAAGVGAQATAETCLLDQSAETLVAKVTSMTLPERVSNTPAWLEQAILSEQVAPGSAEMLLQVPISFSKDKAAMTVALPMVQHLTDGDWDGFLKTMQVSQTRDEERMLVSLVPLMVSMSGRYELLDTLYPMGEGTYTQNLHATRATDVAIEAGRYDQAVDIFAAHKFGNHTGQKYGSVMRQLLNAGAWEEAERLTAVVEEGLAAYEAEGGLSLCLEKRDLAYCQDAAARQPEMARLSAFDGGAYANCYLHHKEKGATATCLNDLRAKADAADFQLSLGAPVPDGITGPAYVELWGAKAMMGDPRPEEIPDETFRETDFSVNLMHARILAALDYQGRDEAFDSYLARLEAPQPAQTPSLLNMTSRGREEIGKYFDWMALWILRLNNEKAVLAAIAGSPDLPTELRDNAWSELGALALQEGDAETVQRMVDATQPAPSRLLRMAQRQRQRGHEAVADVLEAQLRNRVCGAGEVLDDKETRAVTGRLLMQHAVARGDVPATYLLH